MINALEQALQARSMEQQMGLRDQDLAIRQEAARRAQQMFPLQQNLLGLNVQKEQFGLEEARRQQALRMAAAGGDQNALIALDPSMGLRMQQLKQQKDYQDEQLRLKRLEVDPFGMLGGSTMGGTQGVPGAMQPAPALMPPGASAVQQQQPPMEGTGKGVNSSVLQSVPPQVASQVQALAEGRMAFPSGFALKSPYWQKMISLVSDYDPSFDAVNYNARASTRKDFTSGKAANNLTAINTAIGHLGSLETAATALNNGDFPLWNKVANSIASATGQPQINNFNMAKQAVGNELMRVFRQVGASETETRDWEKLLDESSSPAQLKGALKMAADLLDSRVSALNNQYEKGMGKSSDILKVLYPKSREVIERFKSGNVMGQQSSPIFDQADKIIGR